jgi:hypothetical protein
MIINLTSYKISRASWYVINNWRDNQVKTQ